MNKIFQLLLKNISWICCFGCSFRCTFSCLQYWWDMKTCSHRKVTLASHSGLNYNSIPAFQTSFLSTLVWSRGFGSSLSSLRWWCRWTHHGWTLGRKIYQGQQPEDDLKTQQSSQTITATVNHPLVMHTGRTNGDRIKGISSLQPAQ